MALPKKFDDINKSAAGVFKDDFQCKDFQLVAKQKTGLAGLNSEVTVPVFPNLGAKVNFKYAGKSGSAFDGISIDKFDLEKSGKVTVETSIGKPFHGVDKLKLDIKFTDFDKSTLVYSSTYTGVANTSLKLETKHSCPTNFTLEAAHKLSGFPAVVVARTPDGVGNFCPDVGVNYQAGDLFASLIAKGQFTEFTAHALYQATKDAKVAATYQHGGKANGAYAVGAAFEVSKELSAKAKFESSQTFSLGIKNQIAKGTTFFGGVSYGLKDGSLTYGSKLQIE